MCQFTSFCHVTKVLFMKVVFLGSFELVGLASGCGNRVPAAETASRLRESCHVGGNRVPAAETASRLRKPRPGCGNRVTAAEVISDRSIEGGHLTELI